MRVLVTSGLLLGAIVIIRATLGTPPVFLFLAAVTLLLAIFFVWSSLEIGRDKKKMSFEEALSFAMPTLAEEQKVAILRALKDLEYEREVGKISEEDYRVALEDYRARAKASIALADESLALGRERALAWLEKSAAIDQVNSSEVTLKSRVNPSVLEATTKDELAEKVASQAQPAREETEVSGGPPS